MTLQTDLIPAPDGSRDRLLVVLHGLGDSMEGWRFFPEELGLPWLSTLLVNAPDSYYDGFAWYDYFGQQGAGIRRSRALLTSLLESLPGRGFALEKTVLLGFSQGCVMTLDTGFRLGSRLGGLVGISGYVFEVDVLLRELSPLAKQQSVLVTHGTRDPLLPLAESREQVAALKAAGLQVDWREYNKVHTLDLVRELGDIRDFISRSLASS